MEPMACGWARANEMASASDSLMNPPGWNRRAGIVILFQIAAVDVIMDRRLSRAFLAFITQ